MPRQRERLRLLGFLLLALTLCPACQRKPEPGTRSTQSESPLAGAAAGAFGAIPPSASERGQALEEAWANLRWIGEGAAPQGGVASRLLWFDSRPADDAAAIELFTKLSGQAQSKQAWITLSSPAARPDAGSLRPGLCAFDDGGLRSLLNLPDRPLLVRVGPAPLYQIERFEIEDIAPPPKSSEDSSPSVPVPPSAREGAQRQLVDWIRKHLGELFALAFALIRLLGAQIETGWTGVLFRFGRADRVLEPGFHPLIPWLWSVRKLRARAMTFDFPAQKVCNAEGLVYRVDTNLVLRVSDPIKALIEISDMSKGCALAVLTSTQAIILQARRDELQSPGLLDERLIESLRPRLERWGILLEHAGFTSISPEPQSLQVIQQERRRDLRAELLHDYREAGLSLSEGLGLLGQSRARSRSQSKPRRRARSWSQPKHKTHPARRLQKQRERAPLQKEMPRPGSTKTGGDARHPPASTP